MKKEREMYQCEKCKGFFAPNLIEIEWDESPDFQVVSEVRVVCKNPHCQSHRVTTRSVSVRSFIEAGGRLR